MSGPVPAWLGAILCETPELAEAYLVGGCVRDWLLGHPSPDVDVEVYGVGIEALAAALARWGKVDLVGRSFGVLQLTTGAGEIVHVSVPRRDSKVAPGHRGFAVTLDPAITPREAAARRDFTINAMAWDPRREAVLDFFGGRDDLEHRVLRHTGASFVDDPLRVLRGMQLVSRFALVAAPETVALCRVIRQGHRELAIERVREEWLKWATRSVRPSAGLRFLHDTGWVLHYPELAQLLGTRQDPDWHPEGDVLTHTAYCLDALVELPEWRSADAATRAVLTFAVLTHDFGKPLTTHVAERGGRPRIVSPMHDERGGPLAERFLERIGAPAALRARVVPLVVNHLAHLQARTDHAVRRLAKRLEPENIETLCVVITADLYGRPPLPREPSEELIRLRATAAALRVSAAAPAPLLMGRHLLEAGLPAGPGLGPLLEAAYEAQLDGAFADLDGARAWLAARDDLGLDELVRARLRSPADR